jgi:CheY-like chemotaxis protein
MSVDANRLRDRRIFVVEDEMLVMLHLEDLLSDLGCVVVGPASRVGAALEIARAETMDAAILDINVAGEKVFPVADLLAGRGVPFAFLTGYGASGVSSQHRDRPVLQKPYQQAHLSRLLVELLDGR